MKKEESKSKKKARKIVRNEIYEKLTLELKEVLEKNGYESKKSSKEIKKVATYLAKKLSVKSPLGARIVKEGKPVEAADKNGAPVKAAAAKQASKSETTLTEQ